MTDRPTERRVQCACAWRCYSRSRTPEPRSIQLPVTSNVAAPSAEPSEQHTHTR